ncbi:MAG TPA: IclR family transcriptional regulator, partial [Pseudolabrys sp.]|nr:IclR family transcriptional regulator [Pseudolabrys sp.]
MPAMTETAGKTSGSAVVMRALQLIETVAGSERPLTLPELCALLDLPKATTHRLCQQLEQNGYVVREPGGRRYTPGARLLRIGFNTLRSGLTAERHQILSTLVDATGETCNFTTLSGHEVMYLDRVEARWPLRLHFDVGSRVPAHCTASGKLMLAAMKSPERKRVVDAIGLPAHTPSTITNREAFDVELNRIATQGYSLDREEFLLGMAAIAVPVLGKDGAVVAAVACHAPSVRFNEELARKHLP